MPIDLSKAPSTLPERAKHVWVAAFNSAIESTCKDEKDTASKDECAAKVAWGAVKRNYKKDAEGKWIENSDVVHELSLIITKASMDKGTGEMRWCGTASDTGKDVYGESMSLELFNDFIARCEANEPVPEQFASTAWSGGKPYVSVSHYPDLDGSGIAGITTKMYIDGNRFKASGTFANTELGKKAYDAVRKSLYEQKSGTNKPVRISIGFLDWGHVHKFEDGGEFKFIRESLDDTCPMCLFGIGDKEYRKGHLIHLALTRVPANRRTEIGIEEKSETMTTRKEDAESIVGAELAEELEQKAVLVGKSETMLVEKSDTEVMVEEATAKKDEKPADPAVTDEPDEDEEVCKACGNKKKKMMAKADFDEVIARLEAKIDKMAVAPVTPVAVHPLDEAIAQLKAAFDDTVSLPASERLQALQEPVNMLGSNIVQIVRSTVKDEPAKPETATTQGVIDEVNSIVAKSISEALSPLAKSMEMLTQQIASMKSTTSVAVPETPATPARRSIQPTTTTGLVRRAEPSATPHLRDLIERSVGIR